VYHDETMTLLKRCRRTQLMVFVDMEHNIHLLKLLFSETTIHCTNCFNCATTCTDGNYL